MAMRAAKTEQRKKHGDLNIGLLALMLIMFFAAIVVCILITVSLFSVMGKNFYSKVVAGEMTKEAASLADEAVQMIEGKKDNKTFMFISRSADYEIIAIDTKGEPITELDRGQRRPDEQGPKELPGEAPRGEEPPDNGNFGRYEELLNICRELYPAVLGTDEFVKNDSKNGIIAATPLVGSDNGILGALFLIKPINDIEDVSKSLVIVLMLASLASAALMIVPIYFMVRWLTHPIKKLTKAVLDYSDGNLAERVETDGTREVCELGESFNRLADNLQENINELTIERNRLRALLDGMTEGIAAFDMNGGFSNCNSAAAELLTGEPEGDIVSLPEFEIISEKAKEAIASGQKTYGNIECGSSIILVSASPVEEEGGSIAGAVVLLMDITEAERLEQTRRDYVANVSHELRTPLASIRGIADMLNDGLVKNEDDKHRYYGYILKESIRLSNLINDLLELSRLQSGGVALRTCRMELCEIIYDVADRMTAPAAERGMRIELDIPEGRCLARSNPDRIEQVMISLMDNAVKHGSEGGTVRVRLRDAGEKWKISVSNPSDIDRRDLEHIFERFYKADTAHTGEGTGLGLAITEETLRLLDETIGVTSENGVIEFTFTVTKFEQNGV